MFERVDAFVQELSSITDESELKSILEELSRDMGFRYFALTHHVDIQDAPTEAVRIHNYPSGWVEYFDRHKLGVSDPVHRASQLTSIAFPWSNLPRMIQLSQRDHDVLDLAGASGIGDGFTIPAHIPGEANGSCSFATAAGEALPECRLGAAHLAGAFAFEAARRLRCVRANEVPLPRLTDRQRDCLVWAARGKSDWEIGRILGIGQETVIQHLKTARERYGAVKRTQLTVRALFDGTISFFDVIRR